MPKRPIKKHPVTQPCDESYRLIPLTQGQNAIVDAEDFEWLSQWNWFANWSIHRRCFCARRQSSRNEQGKQRGIYMHRAILGCKPDEQCDHKNRNTLDNRKENLRKCTGTQNMCNTNKYKSNTSGFRGVSFFKKTSNWYAHIRVNTRLIHLGCFATPEEAARVYDDAARLYFGEFAHVNF